MSDTDATLVEIVSTAAELAALPDRTVLRKLDDGAVFEYAHGALWTTAEEEEFPASLALPARVLDRWSSHPPAPARGTTVTALVLRRLAARCGVGEFDENDAESILALGRLLERKLGPGTVTA